MKIQERGKEGKVYEMCVKTFQASLSLYNLRKIEMSESDYILFLLNVSTKMNRQTSVYKYPNTLHSKYIFKATNFTIAI